MARERSLVSCLVRPSARSAAKVELEVLEPPELGGNGEGGNFHRSWRHTALAASKQVSWEQKREESCCRIKVNPGWPVGRLCERDSHITATLQRKQLKVGDILPPRRHECRCT